MTNKAVPRRPRPRLYLATRAIQDAAGVKAELAALLSTFDVAAVLLRFKPSDPRTMTACVKALAPTIQEAGVAVLLDGQAELVARSGADGAHLTGVAAFQEALPTLKPERIAGAGGLTTRHDSMSAGEAGADYVLFGEPDAEGKRPAIEAIAERLQWWAELFEPPCVGYAVSVEEASEFTLAGADFILVGDHIWADPRGAAVALAETEQAIAQAFAQGDSRASTPTGTNVL